MKKLIDIDHKAARRFFFRSHNYFSLALPSYFQFEPILAKAHALLAERNLPDYYAHSCHPRNLTNVNYNIIYNKDGEYSWRKYQLLHPLFYTEIVKLITTEENWNFIKDRLSSFCSPVIKCSSIPLAPTCKLNKHEQDIFNWSGNFTNETVRRALEYKYMLVTDMAACYDSLSPHLLLWALYGTNSIPNYNTPLIGHQVYALLKDMTFGQTCGLPQGSVLMDFFAEIILGYLDTIITKNLNHLSGVYILRYRDDYRIFANEITSAERAMKILVETLAQFNLKINISKTFLTADVIKDAFKPDRMEWKTLEPLIFGQNKLNILKSLLLIRNFSRKFTNCGSLKNGLSSLYRREIYQNQCRTDIWQVVSVVVDIMYKNPGIWPHGIAILSKYLDGRSPEMVLKTVEFIRKKFATVPNTEYLDIWLQRLSIKADPRHDYRNPACNLIHQPDQLLWNSDWLEMYTDLHDADIINYDEILQMPFAVPVEEVALFTTNHSSGS